MLIKLKLVFIYILIAKNRVLFHEYKKFFNKENQELIELINSVDVVSFDIFDTLLVRNVFDPIDIFYLMEKDICNITGKNLLFYKLRPACENLARKKKLK